MRRCYVSTPCKPLSSIGTRKELKQLHHLLENASKPIRASPRVTHLALQLKTNRHHFLKENHMRLGFLQCILNKHLPTRDSYHFDIPKQLHSRINPMLRLLKLLPDIKSPAYDGHLLGGSCSPPYRILVVTLA
jgi:hypothetical protein